MAEIIDLPLPPGVETRQVMHLPLTTRARLTQIGFAFRRGKDNWRDLLLLPKGWCSFVVSGGAVEFYDDLMHFRIRIARHGFQQYPKVELFTRFGVRRQQRASIAMGVYDGKLEKFVYKPKGKGFFLTYFKCRVWLLLDKPGWYDATYYWDESFPPAVPYNPGSAIGSVFDHKL